MLRPLSGIALLAALVATAPADDPPATKKAEDAARAVSKQLRAHMTPLPGPGWDEFALRIVDSIEKDEFVIASGWEEWADGVPTPFVTITRGYLAALGSEPDALALLVARGLARLHLGMTPPKGEPRPEVTEADVDVYAVKLLLRSGYSPRRALAGMGKLPEKARPAWLERVAKLLDKPDESLWRAMSAFEMGLTFLAIENHTVAIECFERVTREFPAAHEAWAYLGYARLCSYFDQYASKGNPVRMAGHVLGMTHTLGPPLGRGWDTKRWFDAVGALREAERLKPGQLLVVANLGLAHLIPPGNPVGPYPEAEKYLTAALKALKEQPDPSPAGEVELLVNLAVARLAAKNTEDARKHLDEAATIAAKFPGGPPAQFTRAITFNRALALAADGKSSEAAKLFVRFLETTPRYDPWWAEGYRHYAGLCKKLEMQPLERDKLRKPEKPQDQAAVLASGQSVRPGDDVDEVLSKLPKPTRRSPLAGTSLERFRFDAQGIELILVPDEVFVVTVVTKKAGVPWPRAGVLGRPAGDVRVGMTRAEVEALPGGAEFAPRPFAPRGGSVAYYPAWELAAVYDRDGPDGVVKAVVVGPGAR